MLVLPSLLVLLAAVADAPPPAGLACLARHYAVAPVRDGGRWFGRVGGALIPWDDGRTKTLDQALEAPDLQDMFSLRYTPGAIRPVTAADEDPGRIRVEPLFAATFGAEQRLVDVVPVDFVGQRLRVNRRAQAAFERVATRLTRARDADASLAPYLQHLGGTFVWRKIAGTDRQSAHSYGVSIDLNVKRSHYWRWQRPPTPLRWRNEIPQAIVDAFEAEGFIWGGRWYHYDTMHFEYRPELLDPACYGG